MTSLFSPFTVAIVGGGLVGLQLALGLVERKIPVTVYEKSIADREIGAGIGFSQWGIECMALISPQIVEVVKKVGVSNASNTIRFRNGPTAERDDYYDFRLSFETNARTCHRAHLHKALRDNLPEGTIKFGKCVTSIEDRQNGGVTLYFEDGTEAKADAVIGCDGIKSRVRQLLVDPGHPAASPSYSHQSVYRYIMPMEQAVKILGDTRARNPLLELGPGALVVHYPITGGKMMNIVAYAVDGEEWEDMTKLTAPAKKADVVRVFSEWDPEIQCIIDCFPDELERWGLFDLTEHPLKSYANGHICVAGDAAHAATPHLGQGVSLGVRDCLAIVTLLEQALSILQLAPNISSSTVLEKCLLAYDILRREDSQKVARLSRETGQILTWTDPETGNESENILKAFEHRAAEGMIFDGEGLVKQAKAELLSRLEN